MADETQEPKKSKMWLVVVMALALGSVGVLGVAQAETVRAMLGMGTAQAATVEGAPEEPAEFGSFAELDGIVVNPRGTGGRRYLMVKVGVEAEGEKTLVRLDELRPVAIDAIIDIMSALEVSELTDMGRRDSLKVAVRDRFNTLLGDDGPVTRIYFTQYVLQ